MSILNFISIIAKALLILIIAGLLFFVITSIGEKTLVNQTITIPPGGEKTYTLPPGTVQTSFTTNVPLDESYSSLNDHSIGHGLTGGGSEETGSIVTGTYTISNPGDTSAIVGMHITTGVLNPFGYIWNYFIG
jgi:hypothetical protein